MHSRNEKFANNLIYNTISLSKDYNIFVEVNLVLIFIKNKYKIVLE